MRFGLAAVLAFWLIAAGAMAQPAASPAGPSGGAIKTYGSCAVVTGDVLAKFTAAALGKCASSCSGCGCNGGPGFRGPKGACVGFADYERVCVRNGGPCTAECFPVIPVCLGHGRAWLFTNAAALGLAVKIVGSEITLPPEAPPAQGVPDAPVGPDASLVLSRIAPEGGFACGSKRTCGEMISCEEAKFHHTQCGLTGLARGGGNPCKSLCGR